MGYAITQTPQVWLDHQLSEVDGALQYNWDTVEQLFDPLLLDSVFACWEQLLVQLASPQQWQTVQPRILPDQTVILATSECH